MRLMRIMKKRRKRYGFLIVFCFLSFFVISVYGSDFKKNGVHEEKNIVGVTNCQEIKTELNNVLVDNLGNIVDVNNSDTKNIFANEPVTEIVQARLDYFERLKKKGNVEEAQDLTADFIAGKTLASYNTEETKAVYSIREDFGDVLRNIDNLEAYLDSDMLGYFVPFVNGENKKGTLILRRAKTTGDLEIRTIGFSMDGGELLSGTEEILNGFHAYLKDNESLDDIKYLNFMCNGGSFVVAYGKTNTGRTFFMPIESVCMMYQLERNKAYSIDAFLNVYETLMK